MGKTYVGNASGVAKVPKKIYAGNSSNVAKAVKVVYCGNSSGKAVEVWRNSTLPSTYQKVEYIFNTGGTQWIDTGIKPNSNTELIAEMMWTSNANTVAELFWMREWFDASYYYYGIIFLAPSSNKGKVRIAYKDIGPVEWVDVDNGYTVNQKLTIDFDRNGYFYINDSQKRFSTKTFTAYSIKLPLFGYNNAGTVSPCAEGLRMYHFTVKQDRRIVRDMYPCYLKSNTQTVGMYDLVNGQFYGNSGTGIFYKGPDID